MELQKVTYFFTKLFNSLFSLLKIVLLSKWFVNFEKIRNDKTDCVILANGPCLTTDLKNNLWFISERKKMCVNLFAVTEDYEKIKPDYYILAAPEFWLVNTTDFHKQQRTNLAKNIFEKTSWKLKLFMPFTANNSEFLNTVAVNRNIDIVFFNPTPVEGFRKFVNIFFKYNLGMPRPHNVLVPSIYLAINLGFKKIILFGADHSWHEGIKVDQNNKMSINHEHFYDGKEVRMQMYKLDGKQYFLHDIFRKLHLAFKGYFVLNDYARFMGAKIQNASSKSYIDAFERISID